MKSKIYDLIYIGEQSYMVDKKIDLKNSDLYYSESPVMGLGYWNSQGVQDKTKEWIVIGTTDKSFVLPKLPSIKIHETEELRVIKIIKQVFIKGQMYDIACLFRDAEKRAWERAENSTSRPKQVEVEMEVVGFDPHDNQIPDIDYHYKPKINANNQLIVKNFIYDRDS